MIYALVIFNLLLFYGIWGWLRRKDVVVLETIDMLLATVKVLTATGTNINEVLKKQSDMIEALNQRMNIKPFYLECRCGFLGHVFAIDEETIRCPKCQVVH